MRRSGTAVASAMLSLGMLLLPAPAQAVCAPPATGSGGLLVLDLTGCEASSGPAGCGQTRMGFASDRDGCAEEASQTPAVPTETGGSEHLLLLSAWSPESGREILVDGGEEEALSVPRASSGADLGMWASLVAGLGLAGGQMRRRRGMQVVSS